MTITNQGKNYLLRNGSLNALTIYLGLFKSDPGPSGSASSELASTGNYSRQGPLTWSFVSVGDDRLSGSYAFSASSTWEEVNYLGICSSATRGTNTVVIYTSIPATTIESGGVVRFGNSEIRVLVEES